MLIGYPKEIMPGEGRRGLRKEDGKELKKIGATIAPRACAWEKADLIVKIKQPLPEEFKYFRAGLIVAAFHHLAANQPLMECALNTGATLIDYGTIQSDDGTIPALAAMSKIAGEIAVWDGVHLLKRHKKIILRPGTRTVIIGMGNAGLSAARLIVPTGASLYCLDKNQTALAQTQDLLRESSYQASLAHKFSLYQQVQYLQYDQNDPADQKRLALILENADLVIGCTHQVGVSTGNPVPAWMMRGMPRNSVAVDISIDMGGCFETSLRLFRTQEQHFMENGVHHVCEPNMPGKIPSISTPALCKETFPYIKELVQKGFSRAVQENVELARGVNTYHGWVTHEGLAKSVGRMDRYKPLKEVL